MIEINKSITIPTTLVRRGQKAAERLRDQVLLGKTSLNFRGDIYGHQSVKRQLIADQHGKCCFCETKIGPDGDVEHFRPKAAWCQGDGEPLNWPGYYWLAYEWSNLLEGVS